MTIEQLRGEVREKKMSLRGTLVGIGFGLQLGSLCSTLGLHQMLITAAGVVLSSTVVLLWRPTWRVGPAPSDTAGPS